LLWEIPRRTQQNRVIIIIIFLKVHKRELCKIKTKTTTQHDKNVVEEENLSSKEEEPLL